MSDGSHWGEDSASFPLPSNSRSLQQPQSRKSPLFSTSIYAVAVVPIIIIAVALTLMAFDFWRAIEGAETESHKSMEAENLSVDFPIWEDVEKRIAPSCVYLYRSDGDRRWKASGVVFDAKGHIVTNYHVSRSLDGYSPAVEFVSGESYHADLVGRDINTDLAVFKINALEAPELQPAIRADVSSLRVGQPIATLGTPMDLPFSFTTGVISGSHRTRETSLRLPDTEDEKSVEFMTIQTDTAVNPGNSGSGWFDGEGKLVAILTGGKKTEHQGSVGVDFGIPVDLVEKIAKHLIEYGKVEHVNLGAQVESGSAQLNEVWEKGARLVGVVDGAAARSGLAEGDTIVRVDQLRVYGASSLNAALQYYFSGECAQIKYIRSEKLETQRVCF